MRSPIEWLKRLTASPESPGLGQIKRRKLNRLIIVISALLLILIGILVIVVWYEWAIRPLDANDKNHVRVTIESGEPPAQIAKELKEAKLIRSLYAFQVYTRVSGQEDKLQAGTYAFAPNQSVEEIVKNMTSGKTDEFSITILPGQTLKDIKTMLLGHGYTGDEVDEALTAPYTNNLVLSRPSGASLEGFFYPDTYNVLSDETLPTIFERIFNHYSDVLAENDIAAGFAAHGLNVYQGITLASIVQREVPGATDQTRVAGVFYNRLDADMTLGSDVTFIYAASLLNVEPTPSLDSPYNTRINKGLPPTPISNPELSALKAVANPATSNYLFFLSGDDDVTYFATTDAEHQQNIEQHCKIKCQ